MTATEIPPRRSAEDAAPPGPLGPEELARTDAYWRAANFVAGAGRWGPVSGVATGGEVDCALVVATRPPAAPHGRGPRRTLRGPTAGTANAGLRARRKTASCRR